MRLRFYDPASGRFVSRDPLGLWGDRSQSGSGQGYCGHNPVNRIDPLGLMSDEDTRQLERLLSDHPDSAEAALDYFQRAKREGKLPEEMNELMDELEELEQLETDIAKQDGQLEGRQQLMDEGKDKVEGKPDKEGAKYTDTAEIEARKERLGKARRKLTEKRKAAIALAQRVAASNRNWLRILAKSGVFLKGGAKVIRKVIGPAGLVIAVFFFPSKVEAKGLCGAIADEALDSVPGLSIVKLAHEEAGGVPWVGEGLPGTGGGDPRLDGPGGLDGRPPTVDEPPGLGDRNTPISPR